jgi:hypothetical protein
MPASTRTVDFYIRELELLRERHCAKVLAEARAQAKEIVGPAFREARLRARSVLTEERELLQKKIQAAEARLRAAELQRRHRGQAGLLQLAYDQLLQSLAGGWLDPQRRRRWVFAVLDDAVKRLPRTGWQVRHPEGWGAEEIAAARQHLHGRKVLSPAFIADSGLTAGLRIHCEGVVLDGSVAGLVSDRQRIEARLLALLVSQRERETDEQGAHPLD